MEIETFNSHRCYLGLVIFEPKFVETLPIFVDFEPTIEGQVCQNFILSLQPVLTSKFATRLRTVYIVELLVSSLLLETTLGVKEDTVAILATPLKVTILIECQTNDLLGRFDLLDHFESFSVKKLQISLVQTQTQKLFRPESVKNLELSLNFFLQLQLVSREEIYLV